MFENFPSSNPIIQSYIENRNVGRAVFNKMNEENFVNISRINRAARLLGMKKDGIFVFDDEEAMVVIQEFIINVMKEDGKKIIEHYRDKYGAANEMESHFFEGLIDYSFTSLFEIVGVDRENYTLHIQDLLDENEPYSYIDINLSQSTSIGTLMYMRIAELPDFNISTGCGFPFPPTFKKRYQKEARKLQRFIKTKDREARRFITFYFLHKKFGIEFRTSEN